MSVSNISQGLTALRAALHRSDMGEAGTPVQRAHEGARQRGGEPASSSHWRRVAEPRSGNPLARRDVGNGLFPTHLRALPTPCSGSHRMEIVTNQFEVSPGSVPRCRCVPERGGSPSQKGSEEGNRR